MKTGGRKSRGFESHPLRHAFLVATATILLTGCSFLPGGEIAFEFPADGDLPALPGVVIDQTGTVAAVAPARNIDPPPPIDRGLFTLAAEPNAVIAHWIGGACDERVRITIRPDDGVTVTVSTRVKPVACDKRGIQRAVLLRFADPVDLSGTTIEFDS